MLRSKTKFDLLGKKSIYLMDLFFIAGKQTTLPLKKVESI